MPKQRMIKPEFWTDKKISLLSRDARLFYIALWNHADDFGVLLNNNKKLSADIFPYDDDITTKYIEKIKNEIIKNDQIIAAKYKDEQYLIIKNWHHQQISHPSYKNRLIPEKNQEKLKNRAYSGNSPATLRQVAGKSPEQLELERELERELELELEREGKKKGFSPPTYDEVFNYFEEFKKEQLETKNRQHTYDPELEAEKFMTCYINKKWMVGKTKMTCYKSSIAGWALRHFGDNQKKGNYSAKSEEQRIWDEEVNTERKKIADKAKKDAENELATCNR